MLSASTSGSHQIPQLGPFLIESEIAKGAQGAVYRARHSVLGTSAALKVIHQRDPVAIERFRRETSVLANLHHPGLPQVIDVGEQAGVAFAAFELIEGDTLKDLIRTRGVQPLEWTLDVVARVAEAVEYCHQRGVLHRDLKPENVLIEAATGRPVLVDFGLVKVSGASAAEIGAQERLSLTGEVRGTPNYMAPEQADGRDDQVGPRTDVYGLGALLYFALTSETPFKAPASYNVIVKVMQEPPPDPRASDPSLPGWVAEAVTRAMAKAPEQRFESAGELAALLQPKRAAPAAAGEGLPWLLVGVALLVFLLGGGLALIATLRARAARRALDVQPAPSVARDPTPPASASPAPSRSAPPASPAPRETPAPARPPEPEPTRSPEPGLPREPARFQPSWRRELSGWESAQVVGPWLLGPSALPLDDLRRATPSPKPTGHGSWVADAPRQRLLRVRDRRLLSWTPGGEERELASTSSSLCAVACGPQSIYAASWDARLRALDPTSGAERWSAALPARAQSPPLLLSLVSGPQPDRVLVADASGRLTLCDLDTGAELATLQLSPGPFGAQLLAPPREGRAEVLLVAHDGTPQRAAVGGASLERLSSVDLPLGLPISPAVVRRGAGGDPELVYLLTVSGGELQPHLFGLSPALDELRWRGGGPPVPLRRLTPVDLDGDGKVEVACEIKPPARARVPPGVLVSASDGTVRGLASPLRLLGAARGCLLTFDPERQLLVGWGPFSALPPRRAPDGAQRARQAGQELAERFAELRRATPPAPLQGAVVLPSGRVADHPRAVHFFKAKFKPRRRRWRSRQPEVSGLQLKVARPGDDRGEHFEQGSWIEVLAQVEEAGPWTLDLSHAAPPSFGIRCAEVAITLDGALLRARHSVPGYRSERFSLGVLSPGEHRVRVEVLPQRVPLLYRLTWLKLEPGS